MSYFLKTDRHGDITVTNLRVAKQVADIMLTRKQADKITIFEDNIPLYTLTVLEDGAIDVIDFNENREKVRKVEEILESNFISKQKIKRLMDGMIRSWSEEKSTNMFLMGGIYSLYLALNGSTIDLRDYMQEVIQNASKQTINA